MADSPAKVTDTPYNVCMFLIAALTAAISLWLWAVPQPVSSQGGPGSEHSTPQLTLTWLAPLAYPTMAAVAGVSGNVNLTVSVYPDGSIESVTVLSGVHPLLIQAAVDSAKKSLFICRNCNGLIKQSLIYTFQLPTAKPDPCCCSSGHQPSPPNLPQVSDDFHITITAEPFCVCPDACTRAWAEAHSTYRSAKCLYLWKCGTRRVGVL